MLQILLSIYDGGGNNRRQALLWRKIITLFRLSDKIFTVTLKWKQNEDR